jgi:DNA-binding transcriptional regulator YhcF (GntR family)
VKVPREKLDAIWEYHKKRKELGTVKELARKLNMNYRTVQNWVTTFKWADQ